MLAGVSDVRALLPGVRSGDEIDALILSALEAGRSEMQLKLARYIGIADAEDSGAPVIRTIEAYLGASIYLGLSMSAGQEDDAPNMAQYYRKLAESLIKGIQDGDIVLDPQGEEVDAPGSASPMRCYMTGYLG